jgi:integrase
MAGKMAGKKSPKNLSVALLESLCNAGEKSTTSDARTRGLYFEVRGAGGQASWWYRYSLNRRRREMSLGAYPALGLAEARDKAVAADKLRREGIDPLADRQADRSRKRALVDKQRTVTELIEAFGQAKHEGWAKKTRNTFFSRMIHIIPEIGTELVRDVDRNMARKVLLPIWLKFPPTAREAARYCAQMWDWADFYHWRQDQPADPIPPNPWRHIELGMDVQPEPRKHPSLPWEQMPEFIIKLQEFNKKPRWRTDIDRPAILAARKKGMGFKSIANMHGLSAGTVEWVCKTGKEFLTEGVLIKKPALEALILTALRSSELLSIRWKWIDWDRQILTIPRECMKVKRQRQNRPHIVPLSDRVIEIFHHMKQFETGDYVFPGSPQGRSMEDRLAFAKQNPGVKGWPLQVNSLGGLMLDMGYRGIAVDHGFRSTFENWALDNGWDDRVILVELCLDHAFGNKVHRAYRETTIIEKRRELMQAWAGFCGGKTAEIIPLPVRA